MSLTDKEIEAGWHKTFSTSNPYCPCDLKSFTKAVRWAEHHVEAMKRIAGGIGQQAEPVMFHPETGQPLYAAPAPASPAALAMPAAIADWHAAWQTHVDAVATYNARVSFARANEGKNVGSISVQAEYELMHDAKNKVFAMLPTLFEGIGSLLAASPAALTETVGITKAEVLRVGVEVGLIDRVMDGGDYFTFADHEVMTPRLIKLIEAFRAAPAPSASPMSFSCHEM